MDAVIAFFSTHLGVLAALVVAILDFVFAISPSLAANGILHFIYLKLKSLSTPSA